MTSRWGHWFRAKVRFGLSRLPYCPVRYRISDSERGALPIWWSRVMPFLDPDRGLWDFELYGWDARELRFLRRFLEPGMTFVDVGAYHGLYGVVAGRTMRGTGRIIAFEPTPHDRRRMELHLRLNGVQYAEVEEFAVSASNGTATFYVPTGGVKTIASLHPSPLSRTPLQPITVRTVTLDDYCAAHSLDRIDVIKVDVEGAELDLLAGATRVLSSQRPVWIVEVIDDVTSGWGYRARDILDRFTAHDYALFGFTDDGSLVPHVIGDHYPIGSNANYLAAPRELASRIAERHVH